MTDCGLEQGVYVMDCLEGMSHIRDGSVQVVIADPPYNIKKDFGNDSDKMSRSEYIEWCKKWIAEAFRILAADGTLYIYGLSEILSHVQVLALPEKCHVRWLIWHYTNKNVPSMKFWQRSHESILCVWKKAPGANYPHFNLDDVREPYTDTFLKNAAGKTRVASKGRFSKGDVETTYTAHEKGALPRDVLKVPALAGGAGNKERVDHPTQKPLELCRRLLNAAQKPDMVVVVPFVGSGSEVVVCKELGIPYIGFEINEEYVDLTLQRLAKMDVVSESEDVAGPSSGT